MPTTYQAFCWAVHTLSSISTTKLWDWSFVFILQLRKQTRKVKWSPGHGGVAETWSHVRVVPKSLLTLLGNLILSVYSFGYFYCGRREWKNALTIFQPSKLLHDLRHRNHLSFIVHKLFSQAENQFIWAWKWVPFKKPRTSYLLNYVGFLFL